MDFGSRIKSTKECGEEPLVIHKGRKKKNKAEEEGVFCRSKIAFERNTRCDQEGTALNRVGGNARSSGARSITSPSQTHDAVFYEKAPIGKERHNLDRMEGRKVRRANRRSGHNQTN